MATRKHKFTNRRITVVVENYSSESGRRVEVPAQVYGNWAIHRYDVPACQSKYWTVTHVPTGLAGSRHPMKYREAKRLATAFQVVTRRIPTDLQTAERIVAEPRAKKVFQYGWKRY